MGRFLTADPYRASGGPSNPQSWNRYAYVEGDPVNNYDPEGLKSVRAVFDGLWGLVSNRDEDLGGPMRSSFSFPQQAERQMIYAGDPTDAERLAVNRLPKALSLALAALSKPECSGLFRPSGNPNDFPEPTAVLLGMTMGNSRYGSIQFRELVSGRVAQATHAQQEFIRGGWVWTQSNIQINVTGSWNNSSDQVNAGTLIHELGHVYNIVSGYLGGSEFENDVDSQGRADNAAQQRNREREEKCFR